MKATAQIEIEWERGAWRWSAYSPEIRLGLVSSWPYGSAASARRAARTAAKKLGLTITKVGTE